MSKKNDTIGKARHRSFATTELSEEKMRKDAPHENNLNALLRCQNRHVGLTTELPEEWVHAMRDVP